MKTSLDLVIRCRYSRKLTAHERVEAARILVAGADHLASRGLLTGVDITGSGLLELENWRVIVTPLSSELSGPGAAGGEHAAQRPAPGPSA